VTSPKLGYASELEQLGAVVERLPIGVLIFGKTRHDVVFVNNAARRLLRPVNIRRGASLPEPWPGFSLRHYAERILISGMAPDERVDAGDDRIYLVSGIAVRDRSSGVILIEDVSERERRSRAEREFVANAAHELLTPLTGIVGAAHVLEAGAKEVPEDRDHFIAHIARECSRLTQIARSLLVLARAQSGEEPPRLEILRLRKLLEQAAEQLDATVTIRCAGTVTVLADQDLFLQAAVNLVANSLQHGPGDGVSVEARAIASNLVQIDIVDADGKVPDVSEFRGRFRTGGGRDGGGFGLGLSIAAQSLEAMGGRLLFAGGATRVELPLGKVAS
jgi:signal transduction histidine kinase